MDVKVICWDLDETLGYFRRLVYEEYGVWKYSLEPDVCVRYGVRELLSNLVDSGFKNYLTTASIDSYAELCLQRSFLQNYFEKVFSRVDVWNDKEKVYGKVLEDLKIKEEEAKKNMLIVGNHYRDLPLDLDGVVCLIDENSVRHDSVVVEKVLEFIDDVEGFNSGFSKRHKENKEVDLEGIYMDLKYLPNNVGLVPVIEVKDVDLKFRKRPEVIG